MHTKTLKLSIDLKIKFHWGDHANNWAFLSTVPHVLSLWGVTGMKHFPTIILNRNKCWHEHLTQHGTKKKKRHNLELFVSSTQIFPQTEVIICGVESEAVFLNSSGSHETQRYPDFDFSCTACIISTPLTNDHMNTTSASERAQKEPTADFWCRCANDAVIQRAVCGLWGHSRTNGSSLISLLLLQMLNSNKHCEDKIVFQSAKTQHVLMKRYMSICNN